MHHDRIRSSFLSRNKICFSELPNCLLFITEVQYITLGLQSTIVIAVRSCQDGIPLFFTHDPPSHGSDIPIIFVTCTNGNTVCGLYFTRRLSYMLYNAQSWLGLAPMVPAVLASHDSIS
jgi:hypothetical protein